MEQDKVSKLVEAAKLYYQLDYSQQDIAKILGVSRPTVSRLLQQAKAEGIVRIEIIDPSENGEKLAQELADTFGLKKVLIASVPVQEEHVIKEQIGKLAASYLHDIVKDGDTIGVTWGTTLYQVALALSDKYVNGIQVVQLKGGISHSDTNTYASEILHLFGKAFHVNPHYLPLPAIVDHVAVKQAIEADRHMRKVLDMGKRANIAIFTVGAVTSDSLLFRLGYVSEEDVRFLSEQAVGDICSRFFNREGQICHEQLNNRTIGIELEELRKKEFSILAAGGKKKVDAILGAIKGRYPNVLVTDQYTAKALLEKARDRQK
jgi:deoxyribonucleoside regulator